MCFRLGSNPKMVSFYLPLLKVQISNSVALCSLQTFKFPNYFWCNFAIFKPNTCQKK